MENKIQKFTQFVNETSKLDKYQEMRGQFETQTKGIAVWEISDYSSTVSYGGNQLEVPSDYDVDYDEDGNFTPEGFAKIFKCAADLGADPNMVYSAEDSKLIYADQDPSEGF